MIVFVCSACKTSLSAQPAQSGQLVRCPKCSVALRVPSAAGQEVRPAAVPAEVLGDRAGGRAAGRRYGFNCGYCASRLEATDSMAAQDGQCPTCGNQITIPILDRYGRLVDPRTRQIIRQDPHPVHAYAAAGERAPRILRDAAGVQTIQCPRCRAISPISANNCKACGMPFTMEGTSVEAAGATNGFCVASLVLGIISLPAFCTLVAPVLAIVFGLIGYSQVSRSGSEAGGKGMAIAGMICGGLGCVLAVATLMRWP